MLTVDNRLSEIRQAPGQNKFIPDREERKIIHFLGSCEDPASQARFEVILLYRKGYPVDRIQEETGRARSSIYKWVSTYKQYGLEGLLDRRRGGNNSKLTEKQLQDLTERLQKLTPHDLFGTKSATSDGQNWTVEDLCNAVWEWYGVRYQSRTSYYNLLERVSVGNRAKRSAE